MESLYTTITSGNFIRDTPCHQNPKEKTSHYTLSKKNWRNQTPAGNRSPCRRMTQLQIRHPTHRKPKIAHHVTFTQSSDPAHLTDKSSCSKIDKIKEPEIIGFSCKVSAKGLNSFCEPKLHKHSKLNPNNKEIWDKSYLEEYMGLHEETQTWD